ncbi:hypothetical protein N7523_003209 [Penicillium sp. IBT 18751x]|nr:hypothetical protein N7523_003209 [Penicillium sp. IBT 18751x]
MAQSTEAYVGAAGDSAPESAIATSDSKKGTTIQKRRPRKPVSCGPCRRSKLKCDRQQPCAACKKRECAQACLYQDARVNQHTYGLQHATPVSSPTGTQRGSLPPATQEMTELSATPVPATTRVFSQGQDDTHTQWDALLQRPIDQMQSVTSSPNDLSSHPGNNFFSFPFGPSVSRQEILALLPSANCCDYLVTEYFVRLSPMFHILHGPTFQKQYNAFRQNPAHSEMSWLALLFAICSATLNTMDSDDRLLTDLLLDTPGPRDIFTASYHFRNASMTCLAQDQFLIRHSMSTLEALLLLIYTISNNEGAERAWTLLGLTLNIGIALRCNVESTPPLFDCIETERRRRCWAGILLLHTYQATFFRDVDMAALLKIDATMPADVNDIDIKRDVILAPSSQPTQMSLTRMKIQMFQLSTKICQHLSSPFKYDEAAIRLFDSQVAAEQRQWDSIFLLDGSPNLLDSSSYAHWSILQLYAHQLYLLLHRPFCKPRGPHFRAASRAKCIVSGAALLDVHREFCELPRLRNYRWLVSGVTSFYAIHGAIALASCLLDEPKALDLSPYRTGFDEAVTRIHNLYNKSPICAKAYSILSHIQ